MPGANVHQVLSVPRLAWLALGLSLGAAVSLGVTRFAYGLLLPPMRADLTWSYTLAGLMNTFNALGYLIGALLTPRLLAAHGALRMLLAGTLLASLLMGLSGFFTAAAPLLLLRLLAGVASALVFVSGGVLAARLGALAPQRSGLLLGIYYGGVGLGIVLSALLVPLVLDAARAQVHGWAWAWWALALACFIASVPMWRAARTVDRMVAVPAAPTQSTGSHPFRWRDFVPALAAYAMFGVGYIGYMTFVVALLREQGAGVAQVTLFYALLGAAVVTSSRLWARLLDQARGGEALALLNALLGLATLLPALSSNFVLMLVSGLLFGAVFVSIVASTTALVRHNLAPASWAAGISSFTIVFAAGQIAGPSIVGWIADGSGGLTGGLAFSAAVLWVGAMLAWRQRPLA